MASPDSLDSPELAVTEPDGYLSDLDVTILQQMADDMSFAEIASTLNMTQHHVAVRLARARERLACRSNSGLLATVLRRGLVD